MTCPRADRVNDCKLNTDTTQLHGMHMVITGKEQTSYFTIFFIKLAVYTLQDCFSTFLLLTPPLLALFLRQLLLPLISCILFDVLLFSNGLFGTHDRNIAPCGIICRDAMGAMVFWVCRKWNNKEWWGWFVLLLYLIVEEL